MSQLYEILAQIKNQPTQYLGQTSLPHLFIFLNGYKIARRDLGITITSEEQEFYRDFQPWIQKKLKVKTVNSWANIIQLFCINDREAFNYFFELLAEFNQGEKLSEPTSLNEYAWKNPQATPSITADNNFYQLLDKIKSRPALYLGKRSIFSLQAFLDGYTFACRQLAIPVTEQEQEFAEFQDWIEKQFNQPSTQSWARIILFYSKDESQALDTFFQLFENFLQRESSLDADTISRHQQPRKW
ncbi:MULTISPECIES: hypothetical protein [unclassified Microcoleus]|uniref:hypothetical protein n=2 Tax=unclassified Microcoleus TaxID=2642155 RepID=UPI001D40C645|nr:MULTISPECIES: hypothetical protein [unclassified Microcoleus]MCC3452155.1 hypothetical protein [Microcoleus sp. PH2017_08_TRC_O_A]MCC3568067.1 hypothetical protein [Microcoleus sp. PH2017_31_RDM_U_A]MCC3580346.1 hypothetical protein [Microcoleus sp. PH2017_32_RDM_D_A]MCC3618502.1 hypothetical protein [Microcoleus sp. PH2017_38_RDM_U_B]